MPIPSRSDWGDIDEGDVVIVWTFTDWFDKSFDEAEAMFEDNALHYQEDLLPMPPVPFNYYAPALVKYITSEKAKDDCCGASSFLGMVLWMLKNRSQVIHYETKQQLLDAAHYVADNQDFYGAGVDIFGLFSDRLAEIQAHANKAV